MANEQTGSLRRRLFSGKSGASSVSFVFIANILIQGGNFLCGIVTARAIGPTGRGELAAMIMWPQFFAYALTLGIPVASIYKIREEPEKKGMVAGATLLSSVLLGIVAIGVGLLLLPYALHTYQHHVVHTAEWLLLVAPQALLGLTLTVLARSTESFKTYSLFTGAQPVLILLCLLVEWAFGVLTPTNAAIAYLMANVPVMIINIFWVWRTFRPEWPRDPRLLRDLLSYGLRAWGSDILGTIANQVDRLLIVGMVNPKSMGLYVVAQSVSNVLLVIPNAVTTVLLPKVAARSTEEIVAFTGRAVRVTAALMAAASLTLILLGPSILHFAYSERFDGAAPILRLLLVESVIDGVTSTLGQAFLAASSPGTVAMLQGCGLLTAVPLLLLMVPRWGIMGAAIAFALSTLARFTFVYFSFQRRLGVKPPSLLLRREDLRALRRGRSRNPAPEIASSL
ncbi:oligosaccharide flippase family protein [Silvibacterium dinghuense]|uniref:Polysaccharide biosynthesis protein C-terminal domain-containing protein n=1 Tax=Silvibacterium dinghuense TaxID=1560006 RepID=A0A4Q1SD00_9BACT|nr:oligosaccharide flippase family protein [Silvibacterium dinghuense]RXS94947.1 hypothetical protein ESZ00_09930 [Silvibacterium dinghuense]GGH09284.1 hypothetical protein GCM10011586_27190 [Silvibacterium dinghuense]